MSDDPPWSTDTESATDSDHDRSQREQIPVDELHRLIASSRRRYLLSYLATHAGESVPVDDLVDAVAERERPGPGPASHRERIATDLHHVHLPKLADTGVIDYDPVAQDVRYEASEQLERLLDATDAVDEDS